MNFYTFVKNNYLNVYLKSYFLKEDVKMKKLFFIIILSLLLCLSGCRIETKVKVTGIANQTLKIDLPCCQNPGLRFPP